MAESSGHALLRMLDACNVESLEDYNEHAADALPHNMDASNAAREAPGLESTAGNGVDALEASLASENAGVLTIFLACCARPPLRSRTHADRSQVGDPHFFLRHEGSGHSALGLELY